MNNPRISTRIPRRKPPRKPSRRLRKGSPSKKSRSRKGISRSMRFLEGEGDRKREKVKANLLFLSIALIPLGEGRFRFLKNW
jgi:hypothetical protein